MSIQEILTWFTSGEHRLVAGGVLFLLMWALEKVPFVKAFLGYDGWKLGEDTADAWLTSKRKKLAANVILAMGPTAVMLTTTDAATSEVVWTAVTAALTAAGLNAKLNAGKAPPKVTDPKKG